MIAIKRRLARRAGGLHRAPWGSTALFMVLGFAGCSTPSEDSDAVLVAGSSLVAELRAHVRNTLGGLVTAAQGTEESQTLSLALGTLIGCDELGDAEADAQEEATTAENSLTDTVDFLLDNIIRETWIESDDGRHVTFLVDPVAACDGDASCVEDLSAHPVRWVASKNSAGVISVKVLLGVEKSPLATLLFSEGQIALQGELAEVLAVGRGHLNGDDREDLPSTLQGHLSLSLQKQADGSFKATFAVDEAVRTVVDSDDGPVSVDVAATSNALEATLDPNTQSVGLSQNWAALEASVPGLLVCNDDASCGAKERSGQFHWYTSGASAAWVGSANVKDSFQLTDLGLGDTTATADLSGSALGAADLNATTGRRLTFTLSDAGSEVLVTFEPALDAKLALQLTNLSDEFKLEFPDWLMNEVFEVTFGGEAKQSVRIPKKQSCGGSGIEQAQVESGQLRLQATSIPLPVVADPGMCVLRVESSSDHPFASLVSGDCQ